MAGPWEAYAASAAPAEAGPWTQYAEKAPDPTEGNSAGQNALIGVGKAFADLGRGAKQLVAMGADFASPRRKGLRTREEEVQAEVDDSRKLDAPLMETGGGKAGNIAGTVALAAPTMLIPGANTYTGAAAIGGVMGALQPTATGESRAANTALGVAGGAAGKYAGDKVAGALAKRLASSEASGAAAQATNAAKDAALAAGQKAGYVVPPSQANPSLFNRVVEGASGKGATAQAASVKNQKITNELAKKALGIADDEPLNVEVLNGIRKQAGQAYEALRGAGVVEADAKFGADLLKITQKFTGAAKDFPELAKNEIGDIVAAVNKKQFSTDSAIDAIAVLRDRASAAYGKGDKGLGSAYKQTAQALEDAIERNLEKTGQQELVDGFKAARTLIAKTYSVENALNPTGNVNALQLANQLKKGKPLSDELKTVAEFAANFRKAAQNVDNVGSTTGFSPLDAAVGTLTGGAPGFAWFFGRPVARAAMLSKAGQKVLTNPSYGPGAAQKLLTKGANSRIAQAAAPVLGANAVLDSEEE